MTKVEGFINQQFEDESRFNSEFKTIMNERDISSKLEIAENSVEKANNIPHISAQAYTDGRVDYAKMLMQAGYGNHGSAGGNERDISSKLKIAENSVEKANNIPHISAHAYTDGRVDYAKMLMQAGSGNHGSAGGEDDINVAGLTNESMESLVAQDLFGSE